MTKTILVVDDEPNIVLSLEFLMKQAGFAVRTAADGEEALEAIETAPPDLVLLDINMPKKNGFEVLREMKADPSLRHIPVVMLTTSDREEDIVKSYADGACSFVTKPVDFDQFIKVVQSIHGFWFSIVHLPPE